MKFKRLIQLFTLAFASFSLASCNLLPGSNRHEIGGGDSNLPVGPDLPNPDEGGSNKPTPDNPNPDNPLPPDTALPDIQTISVANLDYIINDFKPGETRTMKINTEPRVNIYQAFANGLIATHSSDPEIAYVSNDQIVGVKPGYTNIKIDTPNGIYTSFDLTIQESDKVEILNKGMLQITWEADDAPRELDLKIGNLSPTSISNLVKTGRIEITSSNPSVILVDNLTLYPKGEGIATITVTYGASMDYIQIGVNPSKPIPITPVKETILNAYPQIYESPNKQTSIKYGTKGVVVATDGRRSSVIYDGYNYIASYGATNEMENRVGRTVILTGRLNLYYTLIEFYQGSYKFIDESIQMPSPTVIDGLTLEEQKQTQLNFDLKTQNITDLPEPGYYQISGTYTSQYEITTDSGHKINFKRFDKNITPTIEDLYIGDKLTITGSFYGYNATLDAFNFIASKVHTDEKAVLPERISFDSNISLNIFDTINLDEYLTFYPSSSNGVATYFIESNSQLVDIKGSEIIAKSSGVLMLHAELKCHDSTLTSNTVTINISNEYNVNSIYYKAGESTLSSLLANTTSNNVRLFKMTVEIVDFKTPNLYGRMLVKDPETQEQTELYALTSNYNDLFVVDNEIRLYNSKTFDELQTKENLIVGNKIQIYAFKTARTPDSIARICGVFIQKF